VGFSFLGCIDNVAVIGLTVADNNVERILLSVSFDELALEVIIFCSFFILVEIIVDASCLHTVFSCR
jgi:hypothetical protein